MRFFLDSTSVSVFLDYPKGGVAYFFHALFRGLQRVSVVDLNLYVKDVALTALARIAL